MREYIVYRHDPSEGTSEKRAILRVQADSAEEACRLAAQQVSLGPGQQLTAEPAAAVDAKE
jgi:hypothetical protein